MKNVNSGYNRTTISSFSHDEWAAFLSGAPMQSPPVAPGASPNATSGSATVVTGNVSSIEQVDPQVINTFIQSTKRDSVE